MTAVRDRALHRRGSAGQALPKLEDLPIPLDVQPGQGWTEQMLEMADHIGAYATLRLIEVFGGQPVYIPYKDQLSPFTGLLGVDTARHIAQIYGGNRLQLPVGKAALLRARRGPIVAAARAKTLSMRDAAAILGTSTTYMAHLVNATDEGAPSDAPARRSSDQLDLFS